MRALLALGRVSNLPTVWANVLAAGWLGGIRDSVTFLVLALGGSLLYVGGTALNDVCDVAFDRKHRPERAIPSGIFRPAQVGTLAIACLVLGAGVMLLHAQPATVLLLVGFIVAYDLLHKKTSAGVVLMAGCRMSLYLAAGWQRGAALDPTVLVGGLGVGAYIVALSTFARKESTGAAPSRWVLVYLLCPLVVRSEHFLEPAWQASAGFFLSWMAYACLPLLKRTGEIGPAVGKWLAGLVLIDLHLVSPQASPRLWITFMGLFLLARISQAFAPAT